MRRATPPRKGGRSGGTGGEVGQQSDRARALAGVTRRTRPDVEQRARVVLVDDDSMARRVVRDALQDEGYVVIAEAAGGREGVELSLYYHPDVVVMDVAMPGMDGLEATRRIVAGDPSIKVVLLTSSDDEAVALAGLRAGAWGSSPRTSTSRRFHASSTRPTAARRSSAAGSR